MPGKRTVSAKRRAASRANGRKSAGPKTLAGKRIASLNAMKGSTATPGCERGRQTATRPLWRTPQLGLRPFTPCCMRPPRYARRRRRMVKHGNAG